MLQLVGEALARLLPKPLPVENYEVFDAQFAGRRAVRPVCSIIGDLVDLADPKINNCTVSLVLHA